MSRSTMRNSHHRPTGRERVSIWLLTAWASARARHKLLPESRRRHRRSEERLAGHRGLIADRNRRRSAAGGPGSSSARRYRNELPRPGVTGGVKVWPYRAASPRHRFCGLGDDSDRASTLDSANSGASPVGSRRHDTPGLDRRGSGWGRTISWCEPAATRAAEHRWAGVDLLRIAGMTPGPRPQWRGG